MGSNETSAPAMGAERAPKTSGWRLWAGPAVTVVLISGFEFIETLPRSEGVIFSTLLAVISIASFLGGLASGLITAGLVVAYGAYFCFEAPRVEMPLQDFLVLTVAAVVVAITVGVLRKWSILYYDEQRDRLEANRQKDELRELVDHVEAIVWEADAEPLRFKFVSREAEDLLGYPVEDWLGDPSFLEKHIHPRDREAVIAALEKLSARREGHDLVYRMVREDGKPVWLSHVAEVVTDPSTDAIKLRGRMVDVTRQKDAERRLAAVHAASRALMEVDSLDEAGHRVLEGICTNLEWKIGALWVLDVEDRSLRCAAIWHGVNGGMEEFIEETLRGLMKEGIGLPGRVWQSGRPLWVSDVLMDDKFTRAAAARAADLHGAFAVPIRSSHDFLGVMEFFNDEIEQPDEELLRLMDSVGGQVGQRIIRLRTEHAVRESEARKAAILEAAMDCIITMDHEGRIIEFNPAAEKTFGWSRDDIIGMKLEETIVPPSKRGENSPGIQKFIETGEPQLIGRRVEMAAIRSDGAELLVELTVTPVETDDTEHPIFTGYIRDITEQKRLQEIQEFLAEASTILASSLDYKTTLRNIMKLAAPYLCDFCFVDAINEDQTPRRLAAASSDSLKAEVMTTFDRYLTNPKELHPVVKTLKSGKASLISEMNDQLLAEIADDEDHLKELQALQLYSMMVIPLQARGRLLGAASFFSSQSGRLYGPEDLKVAEELGRRISLALDNALRYEERSRIARTLQESLLPRSLPEIPGLEKIGAQYRAAGGAEEAIEVGGDFYDLFPYGQTRWGIVIGDVAGKGAQAAALTSFVRSTVYAEAMQEREPRRILSILNEAVMERSAPDQFCTIAYTRLEPTAEGAHLSVVCGGHPQPILLRANGTFERIGHPGTVLGLFTEVSLEEQHLNLTKGDAVIYYTDGVIEARGPGSSEVFGEKRMEEIVTACKGRSATAIARAIENEAVKFSDGRPRDDIAILVLKVK